MTSVPDTQDVKTTDTADAVRMAFGIPPLTPRTGAQEPSAPQQQQPANGSEVANASAPTAADVVAAQQAPPAAPATPEEPLAPPPAIDPYAAAVEAAIPSAPTTIAWDDNAKAAFKNQFGVDDPVAFKAAIDAERTAAQLLKAEQEKVAPVVQALNGLPPAMLQAFTMAMEGKTAEAQAYLRNIPAGVFTNKPSKDIPVQELVEQHFPGKITADQWKMYNDPETDPQDKFALEQRINLLRDTAADKHDGELKQITQSQAQREAENTARYDKFRTAVASTISAAKNSPIGVLMDQGTVDQMTSGQFLSEFVESDGVTPKAEAATRLLYARHGQKLMEAAEARGYKRGLQEGALKTTQALPTVPPLQGRSAGDTPRVVTEADQVKNALYNALTSPN